MKYLYFLAFLGLQLCPIWAQTAPYLYLSKPLDKNNTSRTQMVLSADSLYYHILRTNKDFTYAETELYDAQLNLLKKTATTPEVLDYIGAMNLLGNFYLLSFSYKHNEAADIYEKVQLAAHFIDRDSLKILAPPLDLIAPFTMRSNLYKLNFAVSPSKNRFVVYDYEEDGDIEGVRGLTNKINLRVYDSSLNLLWKRTIDLAPEGKAARVVSIQKVRVDNQGTVGIQTDIFRSESGRSYTNKTPSADPTLFFVGENLQDFTRFTPNLGKDLFYNELDFTFDADGNISWFGCFSKEKYYRQAGVFFIKINQARTKILAKTQTAFTPELIAATLYKKKPKLNRELSGFQLASWRLTETGDLVLCLEYQPPRTYNFIAHQLLVVRLDAQGALRWAVPIQKWGEIAKDYATFLSHFVCVSGDDTYLLYNNGTNSEDAAIVTRLDKNGNRQDKTLFRYETHLELLCPRICEKIGDGKVLLALQTRFFKHYGFGILDLKAMFK